MTKRLTLIILGLLAFFGSIVTFYGTNCFMGDVCNMFHDNGIIASLPILAVCAEFTLATIFVLRYYRYPMYKKALVNLYTIIAIAFSFIGFNGLKILALSNLQCIKVSENKYFYLHPLFSNLPDNNHQSLQFFHFLIIIQNWIRVQKYL